jgi:hypothetical protein
LSIVADVCIASDSVWATNTIFMLTLIELRAIMLYTNIWLHIFVEAILTCEAWRKSNASYYEALNVYSTKHLPK